MTLHGSALAEHRGKSLERANEVRMERAGLRHRIKHGQSTIAQFLSEPIPDWAEGMKLGDLLKSQPLMGPKRMHRLIQEADVNPFGLSTRLDLLTGRQKAMLMVLLNRKARP